MNDIKKTDLIINGDGSIYHLKLRPDEIAQTIILVGDPDRIPMVSRHFDKIEVERNSREFITVTGRVKGNRVSVISTGIGTDNIDIVINEIDALHNIDFTTHTVKENITALNLIRIGTSATIQPDIPIDSWLVSTKAVGYDALGTYYDTPQNKNCIDVTTALLYKLSTLVETESRPYLCNASELLMEKVTDRYYKGISVTMPGFYAPQGRVLRAKTKLTKDVISFLAEQKYQEDKITNIEMETAGIYLLASVLGHHAISFNAILANRFLDGFSVNPEKTVEELIENVLSVYLN